MGKRGPKPKQKYEEKQPADTDIEKSATVAQTEAVTSASTSIDEANPPEIKTPEVFKFDTWIYSEDQEPRILKAGTPIPEGFTRDRKSLKTKWVPDECGKWHKEA